DPYGMGTTGAYWLSGLRARTAAVAATIDASSSGQPDPAITAVRSLMPLVPGDPTPAVARSITWTLGPRPPRGQTISLGLINVGALTIDVGAAGFGAGPPPVLDVTTDGPVQITIGGATVQVPSGRHQVVWHG